jgi:hypothetical protein
MSLQERVQGMEYMVKQVKAKDTAFGVLIHIQAEQAL